MEEAKLIGMVILGVFLGAIVINSAIFYLIGYKEGHWIERATESVIGAGALMATTGPFYPYFLTILLRDAVRHCLGSQNCTA